MKIAAAIKTITGVLALLLAVGCGTTRFKVQSDPDGAEARIFARPYDHSRWELKDIVETPAIYTVENVREFLGDDSRRNVRLVFRKPDYLSKMIDFPIRKNRLKETPTVELERLNTAVNVNTNPPGARITFYRTELDAYYGRDRVGVPVMEEVNLPEGVALVSRPEEELKRKVTEKVSPWRLRCTANFAAENLDEIRWIRIEADEYIPIVRNLSILPGVTHSVEYDLELVTVTLNITSNPEGVIVEDVRPGGFGKLGETHFIENITWDQIKRRPEFYSPRGRLRYSPRGRVLIDPRSFSEEIPPPPRLVMDLRAFKEGYAEWNRQDIVIPLGDEFRLHFDLQPLLQSVRIESEPSGASVYVIRTVTSTDIIDRSQPVAEYEKFLGITPLTYVLEADEPLIHGETIYFTKSGYNRAEATFIRGRSEFKAKLEEITAAPR